MNDKIDYNYLKTLDDDSYLLVKTTLLLWLYSYYETKNLLDDKLKLIFDKIFSLTKSSNNFNIVDPPYFKISVKDIKVIFANAPYDIYTNLSFKYDIEPKTKQRK